MRQDDRHHSAETDAHLLAQLRNLESEALTQVYNRYHTPIYRYISFRVDDKQTVEDLTSEVFTRLLAALQKGKVPRNTLKGWLFGVAGHVITDHYRQKNRWKWTALTDFLTDSADSLDRQMSQLMDKDHLRKHLKSLNQTQQHVLALRFGYGMSIREVAKSLNKSEGSVKMLQARAIAALAREMAK